MCDLALQLHLVRRDASRSSRSHDRQQSAADMLVKSKRVGA